MLENKGEREKNRATRRELGGPADERNPRGTLDEIAIPDYVMRDFGPLEGPRHDPGLRHHHAPGMDAGEDLA